MNSLAFLLCILSVLMELITKLLGFNHSTSTPALHLIVTVEQSDSETTQDTTDFSICTDKVVVNTYSKEIHNL